MKLPNSDDGNVPDLPNTYSNEQELQKKFTKNEKYSGDLQKFKASQRDL
jgi:hypothetical protein